MNASYNNNRHCPALSEVPTFNGNCNGKIKYNGSVPDLSSIDKLLDELK